MNKRSVLLISILLLISIFILVGFFVRAENSESISEWRMTGRNLNHTSWDGIIYPVVSGLNNGSVAFIGNVTAAPAIANGYVYVQVTNSNNSFYQLNASNISQVIATYSAGSSGHNSPSVYGGSVYLGGSDFGGSNDNLYQFNASNISQKIVNVSGLACYSTPSIATATDGNTYVYAACRGLGPLDGIFYQLNASNISQQFANFTVNGASSSFFDSSPAIANGLVYVGNRNNNIYVLNASNVSNAVGISGPDTFMFVDHSPAVYNGSVYISNLGGSFYQLNASAISQTLHTFTTGTTSVGSPVISNGFAYFANTNSLYQLNASSINQQIATPVAGASHPMVYGNFLYAIKGQTLLQLNASNITQQIANLTVEGTVSQPSAANGYVYFGTLNGKFYQVNATNISLGNSLVCQENWTCGNFGDCSSFGTQTRTCTDSNNCNIFLLRPSLSQSCNSPYSGTITTIPESTTTTTSTSIPDIASGTPVTVNINSGSTGVSQITITTNQPISNANLSVGPANRPTMADLQVSANGSVYQSFNISTTGLNDSNIVNVSIRFQVNISWFTMNHLDPLATKLYRNTNMMSIANWTVLPTTLISQDFNYYYFVAVSPGFSEYSVYSGSFSCNTGEIRCFLNDSQACTSNVWLLSKNCQLGCNEGKCITTSDEAVNFFQNIFRSIGNFVSTTINLGGVLFYFTFIIIISGIIVAYIILINTIRKRQKKK